MKIMNGNVVTFDVMKLCNLVKIILVYVKVIFVYLFNVTCNIIYSYFLKIIYSTLLKRFCLLRVCCRNMLLA